MSKRKIRKPFRQLRVLPLVSLALFPGLATADICTHITARMPIDALQSNPETCGTAQSETGKAEDFCAWRFEQSDPSAQTIFSNHVSALENCAQALPSDQRVNHPDSYDLRVFTLDAQTISISLKEKFALSASYIFIRVSR